MNRWGNRKGQTEVYFFIGIIIIAALAIFFLMQSGWIQRIGVPYSVSERANIARESVLDVIREGATFAIDIITLQGGYIIPPDDSITFSNIEVPYWQKCGQIFVVPKSIVRSNIEEIVKIYLEESDLNNISDRVEFDISRIVVSANILDNKIDISVLIPTKVDGHEIPEPYVVSIPTKLGRILDFATDFVNENSKDRLLEEFTLTSMSISTELPTHGITTSCSQPAIYRSAQQISRAMNNIITHVLVNTFWWVPYMPAQNGGRLFAIRDIGGKSYPDLEIKMFKPDGFSLQTNQPVSIDSDGPIVDFSAAGIGIPPLNYCFTPYDQEYSLYYPVIFRVKDPFTKKHFHFAVMVGIKDSDIDAGACDNMPTINVADNCVNLDCNATITVTDMLGDPIAGVDASFAGCPIGSSNSRGNINGSIKCGSGQLILSAEGYNIINVSTSAGQLSNGRYVMKKPERVTFVFKALNTANCQVETLNDFAFITGNGSLLASNQQIPDPEKISSCTAENFLACSETATTERVEQYVTPGLYDVRGYINGTNVFAKNYTFTGAQIVYINLPKPIAGKNATQLTADAENCKKQVIS